MSKSYKKAVTIGVAAFSAVALLTTGAAAFVLMDEAQKEIGGNVSVGTVVESGVELTISTEETAIVLDAEAGDDSGRVQAQEGNAPKMNISIDGSLTPVGEGLSTSEIADKYDLTFTFAVSSDNISVGTTSEPGNTFFPKYVTTTTGATVSEYLTLTYTDTGASGSATACPVGEAKKITVAANGSFSLDIDFHWGKFFGWTNPSIFYDTDSSLSSGDSSVAGGAATSLEAVKTALDTLYDMNGLKFTVTLKAALKTA